MTSVAISATVEEAKLVGFADFTSDISLWDAIYRFATGGKVETTTEGPSRKKRRLNETSSTKNDDLTERDAAKLFGISLDLVSQVINL